MQTIILKFIFSIFVFIINFGENMREFVYSKANIPKEITEKVCIAVTAKNAVKKMLLLSAALIMFVGCKDDTQDPPPKIEGPIDWELRWQTDCDGSKKPKDKFCSCGYFMSFIENYLTFFQCDKIYFVKGIVQDSVIGQDLTHEYGLNIKLLEDLKGNFPQNTGTIFTIFGAYAIGDYLPVYKKQDTLLMLLLPSVYPIDSPSGGLEWYEKECEYVTLECAFFVLKLSNDNVMGFILPFEEIPFVKFGEFPDTISYKYFQKRLQEIK